MLSLYCTHVYVCLSPVALSVVACNIKVNNDSNFSLTLLLFVSTAQSITIRRCFIH